LEEKGTTIVVQGKSIDLLTVAELDVLLAWYQATKSKGAKKADKADQWKQILESGKQPPDYDRWTAEYEERIVGLAVQGNNIDISDTLYGHEVVLKKRELEAAADCMTREERRAWQEMLDALDTKGKAMSSCNMDTAAGVTALSDEGDEGAV
jgi:hypothetical protein